jgi:hypothetical protein
MRGRWTLDPKAGPRWLPRSGHVSRCPRSGQGTPASVSDVKQTEPPTPIAEVGGFVVGLRIRRVRVRQRRSRTMAVAVRLPAV